MPLSHVKESMCPEPPAMKWEATISDSTKEAPTATIPIGAPPPGERFPKNTIRKNEISGSATMIQLKRITRLPQPQRKAERNACRRGRGGGGGTAEERGAKPQGPHGVSRSRSGSGGPRAPAAAADTAEQHGFRRARSPFQQVDLVDVDGFPVAVDQDDDGQADADLGCRHRDDEEREDLPRQQGALQRL